MRPHSHNQGFTLLEVLLALSVFTVIGITTVRSISLLQNTKTIAFEDQDQYNAIRSALSLIRSDLSQSFHVLLDDMGEEARLSVMQGQPIARTLFDGRKKEMIFTTLSHRVYYTGRHESEQSEVSYFLYQRPSSKYQSLMKRESEQIDDDVFKGGSIFTLLDNISDLTFSYWDDKSQKWVEDWSSDQGNYRDRFPYAVKLRVTVMGPRNIPLTVETKFKVANANNENVLVQF